MSGDILNRIPLKVIHRKLYPSGDESVTLLQACYDNPLFHEEDSRYPQDDLLRHGMGPAGGNGTPGDKGPRSKDYHVTTDLPPPGIHFKKSNTSQQRRKVLKIIAIVVIVIIVAITIGLLVHFLGKYNFYNYVSLFFAYSDICCKKPVLLYLYFCYKKPVLFVRVFLL